MNSRATIRLAAGLLPHFDLFHQYLISLLSQTRRTASPGIVTTPLYSHSLAHPFHPVLAFVRCYERISHALLREKIFTAFFRISRSSSAAASSRCKRRISAFAASRSLGPRLIP